MVDSLSIPELSRRCAEETERFRRGDAYLEHFCFELFRRAIVMRDNAAWTAVYNQYAETVRRWLASRWDPEEEGVTTAFERFWRALEPAKFERFASLAAILQYLKLCVKTAVLDRLRAAHTDEQSGNEFETVPDGSDVEKTVTDRLDARFFWQTVRAALDDERQIGVLYLSYAIGLKPSEICARHAAEFPDVDEVYRLKRNAIDRLRRAPEIRSLL